MGWPGDEARKSGEALPELGEKEVPEPGDEKVKPCSTCLGDIKGMKYGFSDMLGTKNPQLCLSALESTNFLSYRIHVYYNVLYAYMYV